MLKSEATKLENQRKMRERHAKEQADYLELKLLWAARASGTRLLKNERKTKQNEQQSHQQSNM